MKTSALLITAILLGAPGCSVKFLEQSDAPSVANTCHASSDCGGNASCDRGACIASSGSIDQILVEVVPDSRSEFGGLSFVSTLDNVAMGDRNRTIALPAATEPTVPAVRVDSADFPNCFPGTGKQQIAARITYTRASSVGGVPILGLPTVSATVDTLPPGPTTGATAQNARISLFPGTYDIYVQPARAQPASNSDGLDCEFAPRMLRGVVVPEGAPASAEYTSLELAKPAVLNGTVLRKGGTLVGWTIDVIEPQEGRLISTVGKVGATSMNFVTNFSSVTYQPLSIPPNGAPTGLNASNPIASGPLVRMIPPPEMATSAPTVYWNLAAVDINGDGKLSLDMTGVPIPGQLVEVNGQVTGNVGVRSSLRFFSVSLEGALGITAVFNPSVLTDDLGRYTIKLFPGQYRVVATPELTAQDAMAAARPTTDTAAPSGATVANPWAITEKNFTILKTGNPPEDVPLAPKIIIRGTALSDPKGAPAMGATFEVVPSILLGKVGVLRRALAQTPALPSSASVPIVDGDKGAFLLPVDPGDFDLSLRPADTSNFAWWVLPAKKIDAASAAESLMARLPLPVPIEGTITIPARDDPAHTLRVVLRSASIRAYAKVPGGTGVTKVGETRTDDSGHYRLGLPASFGH